MREEICRKVQRWLKATGHDLGSLTGTDVRALASFTHLLELYVLCGGFNALGLHRALYECVRAAQPKVAHLFREAIPCVLDWGDRDTLWPQIMAAAP